MMHKSVQGGIHCMNHKKNQQHKPDENRFTTRQLLFSAANQIHGWQHLLNLHYLEFHVRQRTCTQTVIYRGT